MRPSGIGTSKIGFRLTADIGEAAKDQGSFFLSSEKQKIDCETNESKDRVGRKVPITGCGCLLALALPVGVAFWMAGQLGNGLCSFPPYALFIEMFTGGRCF